MDSVANPTAPVKAPYRPRRLSKTVGPFRTASITFSRGNRQIDVTLQPTHMEFRLMGLPQVHRITYEQAFLRAVSAEAGFDTAARTSSRVVRSSTSTQL